MPRDIGLPARLAQASEEHKDAPRLQPFGLFGKAATVPRPKMTRPGFPL